MAASTNNTDGASDGKHGSSNDDIFNWKAGLIWSVSVSDQLVDSLTISHKPIKGECRIGCTVLATVARPTVECAGCSKMELCACRLSHDKKEKEKEWVTFTTEGKLHLSSIKSYAWKQVAALAADCAKEKDAKRDFTAMQNTLVRWMAIAFALN